MAKTATMSGDRLFWGRPAQVRTARRFVVASLAGRPVAVDRDVVALLVSELVTNAVVHSASGRADGTLLVSYQLARDELDPKRLRLRVEVRDLGGPGYPRRCEHALESSGRRGLEVVEALASRWGVGRHPRGRVVWFELELALVDRGGGAWSDCATEVPAPSVSTSRETLALLK
jgi:anti-sigma regulatory factor (Ser/Thr protein kinase)